jgi:hypothetical protein
MHLEVKRRGGGGLGILARIRFQGATIRVTRCVRVFGLELKTNLGAQNKLLICLGEEKGNVR